MAKVLCVLYPDPFTDGGKLAGTGAGSYKLS
jgi:hypothetical protein